MDRSEEFINRLIMLQDEYEYDPETAHQEADSILCDLLLYLGCREVVTQYNQIKKDYSNGCR